jgi:hypothetical protein
MKKIKSYSEADLIEMFGLENQAGNVGFPLMEELTSVPNAVLNIGEQQIIDTITDDLQRKINGWNEEMLKMNFIAFVILLGHLTETKDYKTYYESVLEATVEGYFLKVKADMMVAKGILEVPKTPFFYFQEYKKQKDPTGDVTAQVLEAFLIAQSKNNNQNALYGCTVIGKYWEFMTMQNQTYCISDTYICTEHNDLMKIIAILRKFKYILETRLLD